MAVDPKRNSHVEHALASIRLSGYTPSTTLLELTDQYRHGTISGSEMVERMRDHYRLPQAHKRATT